MNRNNLKTLAAICGAILLMATGEAFGWSLEELNKTVNQTNFIVGRGCSGTLISLKHKLILTNHHCIDDFISAYEREEQQPDGTMKKVKRERRGEVRVSQRAYLQGQQVGEISYQTTIAAHKKTSDLALLQIKAEDLPYTAYSRVLPEGKDIQRGQNLYVVGNPAGLDATVVAGIVSSTNRREKFYWTDYEEVAFVQFSGGVWFGNSGGALYSDTGYLIGVPAVIVGTAHLGLAIHYNTIRAFLKENCYEEVYSEKAEDFKTCVEKKEKELKKKEGTKGTNS